MKITVVDYKNSPELPFLIHLSKTFSSDICFFELPSEEFLPYTYFSSLCQLYEQESPSILLFPHTNYGCELASRLSAEYAMPSLTNIIKTEWNEHHVTLYKNIYNMNLTGKFILDTFPFCITCTSPIDEVYFDSIESFPQFKLTSSSDFTGISVIEEEFLPDKAELSNASLVLASGRGIGGKENIAKLKKATSLLDCQLGCSRPVVMDGLLGTQHLIGMSGHLIAPSLCITMGVSGAAAFLTGIYKSKKIIAINKDEKALIFSACDIGIIGDCIPILDELLVLLEKENSHDCI